MNILFFLTPKIEVAHLHSDNTVEHALERMESFQYSAVPIIDRSGHYKGTITEGDLLWYIRKHSIDPEDLETVSVMDVQHRNDNRAVTIDANIEDLMSASLVQNFVPVVDDDDIFIGIVKRKDIISYFYDKLSPQE